MNALVSDIKYSTRQWIKSPGFTAVAVLSLALGIGANAGIFSLLNAVLLRSMPVRNPHELRTIGWVGSDDGLNIWNGYQAKPFPYPTYCRFRDQVAGLSEVAAFFRLGGQLSFSGDQTFESGGLMVSGNFFQMLGLRAVAGRTLMPEDDRPAAAPVVTISCACWQRHFSSDPEVIGKAVTINQQSFTIVGILPEGFHGIHAGMAPGFYVPMSVLSQFIPSSLLSLESKEWWWVEIMGRLRSGADERQVQAALNILFSQRVGATPENTLSRQRRIVLEDGSGGTLGPRRDYARSLPLLLGAVGLVLLVACANLAGLLLARAVSRQHEMAVRAAVGASRWRLLRQAMTESLLLACGGAGLGLILAAWGKGLLFRLLWPSTDRLAFDLTSDIRVLAFAIALTLASSLLFGLAPAWRVCRVDPAARLKDRAAIGAPRLGLGRVLVAVQVGLCLVLLVGAGLFLRTLMNVERVNPGFNTENLLVVSRLGWKGEGYSGRRLFDFYQELGAAIRGIPGVQSVALSDTLPLSGGIQTGGWLNVPDSANPNERIHTGRCIVSESFFSTMEVPLKYGRAFTAADDATSRKVIIVNEALAREYFPNENPVGRVIRYGGQTDVEIVGVCQDMKVENIKKAAFPTFFLPYRQSDKEMAGMAVEIRTLLPPLSLAPAVRRTVAAVDRQVFVADITTQRLTLRQSITEEKMFATLCGMLAGLAVLLSCIGLYGLMAHNVARRTGEIGIRVALGATRRNIAGPILREAVLLAAFGVAMGVPAAIALTRFVKSQLYGVQPNDPLTVIGAGVLLIAVAVLAAWIPARRAARIDPMKALRYE